MARLKVFATQLGFYDTVVAAPSRKAALDAWGLHQDLFASGAAKPIDDAAAVKAALAQPGVVLKRAVGASGAFAADAGLDDLKIPAAPTRKAAPRSAPSSAPQSARPSAPMSKPPKPAKPPPDRAALSAAEAAIADRRRRYQTEREALEARRKALAAEAAALGDDYAKDNAALEAVRSKAQAAYRRAGG